MARILKSAAGVTYLYTFLIIVCAALGLVIGSFLNVVIYRVPRHLSIVRPGSACPTCSSPIPWWDNIPVFSWLTLRGHCRKCRTPISIRYPLVEFGTGALFAGVAARLGADWAIPAFLVVVAGLFALSWIDVEHLTLPKVIVYPMLGLELVLFIVSAAVSHNWHDLEVGCASGAAWFAIFFIINLIEPKWLGFGDVRLALVLGLALGWLGIRYVLLGFFAANVLGAVIGIALILTKRMTQDQPIPYGVFLATGTALALFAGSEILSLLQNAVHW